MPWIEVTPMSQRHEFVRLATQPDANIQALCRRFGISRKTGYKWLARYRAGGMAALADQSRRPHHSPTRTSAAMEARLVDLHALHEAWGGRTLAAYLRNHGVSAVPAPSTITGILRRHPAEPCEPPPPGPKPLQRFERDAPNELWQMDFKGHFPTATLRCHPLTVLDDHARFALVLQACADETTATVQTALIAAFERYGLPEAMLTDNGAPWGDGPDSPYTRLGVWLLRLGIRIYHGRPYHPQTQGKEERFHRTLHAEVLLGHTFRDLAHCQAAFDAWRDVYNLERPHHALGLQPPVTRYQVSPRPYPGRCPPIEYGPDDIVRHVQDGGWVHFRGRVAKVSKAFVHQPVAIRPVDADGTFALYFCGQRLTQFILTDLPRAG